MDLLEIEPNIWYMHIVDEFPHLNNASLKSKIAVIKFESIFKGLPQNIKPL